MTGRRIGVRRQADEGANYNDSVAFAAKPGDGVPPGGVYTYRWAAPARAGPGPDDGDTVSWLYHSHLDEGADVAAGLVRGGPECRSSAGIHSRCVVGDASSPSLMTLIGGWGGVGGGGSSS